MSPRDVVIIGSGPAGLTAALYAARANLKPIVIEGLEAGGQLMLTTHGGELAWFPRRHHGTGSDGRDAGASGPLRRGVSSGNVTSVDFAKRPFTIRTADAVFETRAVIIATGASARLIGLPSERALIGHGVSTCATCDGFFFRGKPIAVVGGGDSAMEEAIFLTKFASHVTVIHRRDTLRASKIMQDKAFANPKISFEWNSEVEDVKDPGTGAVNAVVLSNTKTGERKLLEIEGLFVAIGHTPNTAFFHGQIAMDPAGYIITQDGTRTNIPGVFACGDVQDQIYRQAITAAGSGCMAAIDAERYLDGLPQHLADVQKSVEHM